MRFLHSLQDIIKNEALPYVNKSIALLAISNIYTMTPLSVPGHRLTFETKKFGYEALETW